MTALARKILGIILVVALIFIAFPILPHSSAYGIIQDRAGFLSNACGAVSTGSNAFSAKVTAGDTLVAMVAYSSGSAQPSHDITVASNESDVWHRAVTSNLTSGVAGQYVVHVGIFYAPSAVGGATSVTCSITGGASGGDTLLSIFELPPSIFEAESNNTYPTGNINSPGVTIGSSIPIVQLVFSTVALNGAIAGTLSCTCSLFNNLGNGITNALADGTGSGKWTATANFQYVEADAGFASSVTTVTSTYTGYVAPNSLQIGNWLIPFFYIMLPAGLFMGIALFLRFEGTKFVFITLLGIVIGSFFAVFAQVLPLGATIIFTSIFLFYVWRSRTGGSGLPMEERLGG